MPRPVGTSPSEYREGGLHGIRSRPSSIAESMRNLGLHTPIRASVIGDELHTSEIFDSVAALSAGYRSDTGDAHKKSWGQFFTSPKIATFMASLLDNPQGECVRILDPGAGTGSRQRPRLGRFGWRRRKHIVGRPGQRKRWWHTWYRRNERHRRHRNAGRGFCQRWRWRNHHSNARQRAARCPLAHAGRRSKRRCVHRYPGHLLQRSRLHGGWHRHVAGLYRPRLQLSLRRHLQGLRDRLYRGGQVLHQFRLRRDAIDAAV
jgi:hypothetical protein